MNWRDRLFAKPSPAGWVPGKGEHVVLRPVRPVPGKPNPLIVVATAKVVSVAGRWAVVSQVYGHLRQRTIKGIVDVEDLRPYPERKV